MIKIDTSDIKQLEHDLGKLARKALPFATRSTVNTTAFKARTVWQANIGRKMIERNQFTRRSLQVDQAKTLRMSRQAAVVGSIAPYMPDQEFGGTQSKTGRHGVAIPTAYAAGQGMTVQPRTRLPRRPNQLKNIRLSQRGKRGQSRGQRNTAAIHQAATGGRKFVFLDLGRTQGIFKVIGGKRKPRIRMVYDLSRDSVVIPANPTLGPSVPVVQRLVPGIYRKALEFQIKRHSMFN